jgi:predicted N-acetyltransferase YhbS
MDSERRGLFHLVVVPELRNQGLGRLLVGNVEDSARQTGSELRYQSKIGSSL